MSQAPRSIGRDDQGKADAMATKELKLRRPDMCSVCVVELSVGTVASWDSVAKTVTCLPCSNGQAVAEVLPVAVAVELTETALVPAEDELAVVDVEVVELAVVQADAVEVAPIDVGRAGVSARKEYLRRQAKQTARIEEKWGTGRIGRIAKRFADEPQSTTAWAKGAAGEERVAEILVEKLGARAVLLHDRKVPKTRGNIDHLAVAPSGVWIIDAKRYAGKVETRNAGVFFRPDHRLFVGGRDRTKAVDGLGWQVDAVRTALSEEQVTVHSSLSFVGAEWPLFFAKPFQIKGVWVSWPAKLAELIAADGPLSSADVDRVARMLAGRLRAN